MEGWFAHTGRNGRIAEINVPPMALYCGLLSGNGVRRVVQLRHYHGYSALLLGFVLKRMGLDAPGADGNALVYTDACGLGILQRLATPAGPGSSSRPPGDTRSTADAT
jgi:hypothetical protein